MNSLDKDFRHYFLAYLKLISVIFIWGGGYHVVKFLLTQADVLTICSLRFILSSIFLLLSYYYKNKSKGFNYPKKAWGMFFIIGTIGFAFYNLLFVGAESLLSANNVAILFAFAPCITAVLMLIFFNYQINYLGWLGIMAALLGTIGVINLSNPICNALVCKNSFTQFSSGQILAVCSVFCMSIYNVLSKKASELRLHPLSITTFSSVFAAVILLVVYLVLAPQDSLLNKPFTFWLGMIYLSLFGTSLGYKWYVDSIKEIGVSQVAVFLNGLPFATIIVGLFLGKVITLEEILCGLVIISGVIITNFTVKRT